MDSLTRRAALGFALAGTLPAWASDVIRWPVPRLTLMLAYPPGGISDRLGQDLAARLRRSFGLTVLAEHRPGAGGTLAMERLSQAPGDASVLLLSAVTPLTLAPWLGPLRYDPVHDVVPLRALVDTPLLVVGSPSLQAQDWAGMVEQARTEAGGLRWATSGVASTGHLVMEQVRLDTRAPFVHVPYAGGGRQLQDALAGHFELLSTNLAADQLTWLQQGRLKALALGAPTRHPMLPGVPTLSDLGHPAANRWSTFGVFAPGTMSPALSRRVLALLAEALDGDWQAFVRSQHSEPASRGGERFAAWLAESTRRNQQLVNEPGFAR
jgi:tripartite-type tricarboxylate transporter receptor subunit TctC